VKRIVALAVLLLVLLPTTAGASRMPAFIDVSTMKPFVVKGTHFKRGETVRVTTQLKGKHVRTVKASRKGVFVARFLRLKATFCSGYHVRAIGNKGSHAFAQRISDCAGG
jgi:hypothetical protein